MPDLIEVAVEQLQAVERELAALKARADELRTFIATGKKLASRFMTLGAVSAVESPDTTSVHGHINVILGGVTGQAAAGSLVPAAQEPIKVRAIRGVEAALQNGQPKTARQLVNELAAMGIVIGGQSPPSNLSAILSQAQSKFRNVKGQGYFLVEPQRTEPTDAQTPAGSLWFDPPNAPGKGTATAAD